MSNYPIQELEANEIIKYFLQKPTFLSSEDEKELIDLIKANKIEEFYDYASKLIKNTRDITNLYTYLLYKLESQNISNEELKNQVCWRLFNISSIGWLNLKDPEIIEYCKKNTTDKDLLDEINAVESVNWFKEYLEFAQLEKHISNNLQNVEKDVEKYLEYINKLYENERISQEKYEQVIGYLQLETSIYKGKQLIGALISKKLQEKLGFKTTVPKISVTSDSKLISQDE